MIVVCSGLIGAGKSTLCEGICKRLNGIPVYEPVESNPYLELYYKEPKKYAFGMQMRLLLLRMMSFKDAVRDSLRGNLVVCDRSIFEDWAFAYVNYKCGNINELDMDTYDLWHTLFTSVEIPFPSVVFNLKCSIDTLEQRIEKRNRECEQNGACPREYLEQLNDAYKILFDKLEKKVKVFHLDAEKSEQEVLDEACRLIEMNRNKEEGLRGPVYHGGF